MPLVNGILHLRGLQMGWKPIPINERGDRLRPFSFDGTWFIRSVQQEQLWITAALAAFRCKHPLFVIAHHALDVDATGMFGHIDAMAFKQDGFDPRPFILG